MAFRYFCSVVEGKPKHGQSHERNKMISITTYNCRGLPITNSELKKKPELYQVLNEADIVLLQEIWLAKQQMGHL